jgi:hypothetical protein
LRQLCLGWDNKIQRWEADDGVSDPFAVSVRRTLSFATCVTEKAVPYCLCPTRLTSRFGLALVIAGCGVTQVKDADPEAVAALNGLRYPSPDAHPKAHGCVKAEIRIVETLPAALSKGMSFPVKRTRHGFASQTVPLTRRVPTSKAMRVAWQLKC